MSIIILLYFLAPQALHSQCDTWKLVYGPGLWFYVENNGRLLFYEKDGENPGVSGLIRHYPGPGLTMVILCNMQEAAWAPARHIHNMVIDGRFGAVK